MKANQTRGETGHRLVYGFDVQGGIRVDTSLRDSVLHEREATGNKWKIVMITNLLNSSIDSIQLLAMKLLDEGFLATDKCSYTNNKRVHFIRIGGREYKILGKRIITRKING